MHTLIYTLFGDAEWAARILASGIGRAVTIGRVWFERGADTTGGWIVGDDPELPCYRVTPDGRTLPIPRWSTLGDLDIRAPYDVYANGEAHDAILAHADADAEEEWACGPVSSKWAVLMPPSDLPTLIPVTGGR